MASLGEIVLLTGLASADTFWDVFWFYPVSLSFLLMLPAFTGTRLRYQGDAGGIGKLGLALSVGGCAGMIVFALFSLLLGVIAPDIEQGAWANAVIAVCLLSLRIGYVMSGLDVLRYKLLPRWNLLPLLVGLTVMFAFAPDWLGVLSYHPLQFAASFLHFAITGACWVLLGITMINQREEPEPAAAI